MSDWTSEMVKFDKDMTKEDTIRTRTFRAVQEWSLCDYLITQADMLAQGHGANNYPLYHISCHVKRKSGYYLLNIAIIIVRTFK